MLSVDVEKAALVAELLSVASRAGEPAVTATIDAALDDVIARALRTRAIDLLGDRALVDFAPGRDDWR